MTSISLPLWKQQDRCKGLSPFGNGLNYIVQRTPLKKSTHRVSDSKMPAAFCAARRQHSTTILGRHAQTETMFMETSAIVGLESHFHSFALFILFINLFHSLVPAIFRVVTRLAIGFPLPAFTKFAGAKVGINS